MPENSPAARERSLEQIGALGSAAPGTTGTFESLHTAAIGEGALTSGQKEPIALGIGIAVRCHGCIASHVHGALDVAVLMGGGPSVVSGAQARRALSGFLAANARVTA